MSSTDCNQLQLESAIQGNLLLNIKLLLVTIRFKVWGPENLEKNNSLNQISKSISRRLLLFSMKIKILQTF